MLQMAAAEMNNTTSGQVGGGLPNLNPGRKRKIQGENSNGEEINDGGNLSASNQPGGSGSQQNNGKWQRKTKKEKRRDRKAKKEAMDNEIYNQFLNGGFAENSGGGAGLANLTTVVHVPTKRYKKGLAKMCKCEVTVNTDTSMFNFRNNCIKCRPAKKLARKQKKITRKMLVKVNREKRDIDDRGVVTLQEEDEQYLTSLLQEITESKKTEELPQCEQNTQLLGDICDKSINNGSVSGKAFQDSKLGSNMSLDNELYYELRSKEDNAYRQSSITPYQKMSNFRKNLPAFKMKREILDMIEKNQVSLISGETGCGKTTQVAQYVLDDYTKQRCGSTCHIICTQPRRISAISVAERVASERGERLGRSCGYIIRLEKVAPRRQGSILFCTLGVLLRFMINDPYLKKVSHVIIDEIHERDTLSDFLLIIIRDILPYRPNLKIILMSATLNADMFSKYFDNCPMINIPGRTHPVKEYYLEEVLEKIEFEHPQSKNQNQQKKKKKKPKGKNRKKFKVAEEFSAYVDSIESTYTPKTISNLRNIDFENITNDLIIAVVNYICKSSVDGAILIFLPGWKTISKLLTKFNQNQIYSNRSEFVIVPIHSKLPSVSQKEVFERPPRGCRKIVIATNIVETSITIDDIIFVIDCGKVNEIRYDAERNISSLETVWISKASEKQRRGRAGRVQPGQCYHLFTKFHEDALEEYQEPEISRTPLDQLCLQIKILKCRKIWPFLSKAIQPPTMAACELAVSQLVQMRALDKDENLTSLGYHLALLPVAPKIGRMMLSGAMFSCLNPVLTVAASLESKDPFSAPMGMEQKVSGQKCVLAENSRSDHMVLINAFDGWEHARRNYSASNYCREYFLSANVLETISGMKKQFARLLNEIGFVQSSDPKDPACNRNSDNINLIKAIICAGLYPNVAKVIYKPSGNKFSIHSVGKQSEQLIHIHPKSVNSGVKDFRSQWIIYHEKMRTTRLYIYDATVISPYPLLFFGGVVRYHQEGGVDTIEVDDGIKFHSSIKTAEIVINLRKELDELLSKKINNPTMQLIAGHMSKSHHEKILKAIIDLISSEKMQDKKSIDSTIAAEDEVDEDEVDEDEAAEDEAAEDEADEDEAAEDEAAEDEAAEDEAAEDEAYEYEAGEYEGGEYEGDEYDGDEYEADEYEADSNDLYTEHGNSDYTKFSNSDLHTEFGNSYTEFGQVDFVKCDGDRVDVDEAESDDSIVEVIGKPESGTEVINPIVENNSLAETECYDEYSQSAFDVENY